jgi:hypothetical protein
VQLLLFVHLSRIPSNASAEFSALASDVSTVKSKVDLVESKVDAVERNQRSQGQNLKFVKDGMEEIKQIIRFLYDRMGKMESEGRGELNYSTVELKKHDTEQESKNVHLQSETNKAKEFPEELPTL